MPNQQLINYVVESRKQGMNDGQIKNNLLSSGWPENDINEALNPQAPIPPTPIAPIPQPGAAQTSSGQSTQINLSDSVIMAVLAYLGFLIIIPFLLKKSDSYVKFHIKQGLAYLIFVVCLWILSALISFIILPILPIFAIIFPLLWLLAIALCLIGIINAATGKTKELPLIGGWGNKFNF